ncbi:MAG: EAL domain-containing protein [Nitrospirae bacterium]|nr:EAL domain-containing protein [Nitrospirota bacterium]
MPSEQDDLLKDGLTGFPSLPAALPKVKDLLANLRQLGLIYVDLTQYSRFEEEAGRENFDHLVKLVSAKFEEFIGELSSEHVLTVDWPSGGDLIAFVGFRDESVDRTAMHEICQMLNFELMAVLESQLNRNGGGRHGVFVGYDVIEHNPLVRFERLVHRGINEALHMALNEDVRERNYRAERLRDIVRRGDLRPMFQPIVNLQKGYVLGYEVLIRGPENTKFEDPSILFSTAHTCSLTLPLEQAGQKRMVDMLRGNGKHLYFINVEPNIIESGDFQQLPILQDKTLPLHRIVIEVTERAAIKDPESFARILKQIKARGLRVAVDDVGSGYSSIESVAFLKPDFIKIDHMLVHGIHEDSTRREIATTILQLSQRINSNTIAEGIERAIDFETLVNLGVELGQGFHIGRPRSEPYQPQFR